MSILTFLGRDSGFGKKNNSAYIEDGNKLILIDCGFTVFEQIKEKIELKKYEKLEIIITHLHNDHAGSLSQIILYMWYIQNKKTTIFSKCSRIKEYLEITGTPNEAYELKDSTKNLEFIKTEHSKNIEAYGFCLKIYNKKIVYTGDTSIIETFLPYLQECSEFYIDVSKNGGAHIKIDDVIPTLKNIKKSGTEIYLMHMDDKTYIKEIIKGEFYIE